MTKTVTPALLINERLLCTCIWFTREGDTMTQHWQSDPQCPAHGELIKAATQGLTLTGLPEKSPADDCADPADRDGV